MDGLTDFERGTVPKEVLDDPDPGGSSVRRLGRALTAASYWIEREMTNADGGFKHPDARRTAHRLVAKLDQIVALLQKYPPPPNPDVCYIPPCPVCKAKPGQHWAHECPQLERHGREVTYDYRKNERLFYDQIRPFAEPLKPHPRDLFTCVVCRSRWQGRFAEELIEKGDDFGEAQSALLFKLIKERNLA